MPGPKPRDPVERFLEKVVTQGECRIWTGAQDKNGYALFQLRAGKLVRGHRWWYEQRIGEIPVGMNVLHSCDTPPCVNEAHFFLGTTQDNNRDRDRKGRTSKGENHYKMKVTDAQVAEMRARKKAGEKVYQFFEEYGISYGHAKSLCSGRFRVPGELTDHIDQIIKSIDETLGDTLSDVQEPEVPETDETEPEDAEADHGEDSFNPTEDDGEAGDETEPAE